MFLFAENDFVFLVLLFCQQHTKVYSTRSLHQAKRDFIIIIIVIILLDLHSFDTPHIPTVTFLTVLEVDSVDTYG